MCERSFLIFQSVEEKEVEKMAFDKDRAIEKGVQALGTTGPAAAIGAAIGYGLPGSIKELRGSEPALVAVSTTLVAVIFNAIRNWWKHRRG